MFVNVELLTINNIMYLKSDAFLIILALNINESIWLYKGIFFVYLHLYILIYLYFRGIQSVRREYWSMEL